MSAMNTRYYKVKGSWWADTTIPTSTGEVQVRTWPFGGSCKTMAMEFELVTDMDEPRLRHRHDGWERSFGYHHAPGATKRNVTEHHEHAIAQLRTLRPELFTRTLTP